MARKQIGFQRTRIFLLVILLTHTFSAVGDGSSPTLQSGPGKVALLELYTSQGCSSCPPADRWMSGLERNPGLWKQFVPVAFHVDYWDYIGWRDPFSRHAFSLRQRRYAKEGGIRVVYTPAILISGKEWRNWALGAEPRAEAASAGLLTVRRANEKLLVSYVPAIQPRAKLFADIALLGFGLVSDVTAGENRGRKLVNDFTVLKLERATLRRGHESFETTVNDFDLNVNAKRFALAVWVHQSGSQKPLQAVGGWYR